MKKRPASSLCFAEKAQFNPAAMQASLAVGSGQTTCGCERRCGAQCKEFSTCRQPDPCVADAHAILDRAAVDLKP
jgi:hypothetical protein